VDSTAVGSGQASTPQAASTGSATVMEQRPTQEMSCTVKTLGSCTSFTPFQVFLYYKPGLSSCKQQIKIRQISKTFQTFSLFFRQNSATMNMIFFCGGCHE
jgi:hypothetical protein